MANKTNKIFQVKKFNFFTIVSSLLLLITFILIFCWAFTSSIHNDSLRLGFWTWTAKVEEDLNKDFKLNAFAYVSMILFCLTAISLILQNVYCAKNCKMKSLANIRWSLIAIMATLLILLIIGLAAKPSKKFDQTADPIQCFMFDIAISSTGVGKFVLSDVAIIFVVIGSIICGLTTVWILYNEYLWFFVAKCNLSYSKKKNK